MAETETKCHRNFYFRRSFFDPYEKEHAIVDDVEKIKFTGWHNSLKFKKFGNGWDGSKNISVWYENIWKISSMVMIFDNSMIMHDDEKWIELVIKYILWYKINYRFHFML